MTKPGMGVLVAAFAALSASGCSPPAAPSNQQAAALPPPPVAAPAQVGPLDPDLRERIRQRDARIEASGGGSARQPNPALDVQGRLDRSRER